MLAAYITELIGAIQNLLSGRKFITSSVAEVLVSNLQNKNEKYLHSSLSDREFEIFCSMGSGNTVSQIAMELCLSVKTISTHRSKILIKMVMKTNADIVQYVWKHRLIG